jgi:hypothetical protein
MPGFSWILDTESVYIPIIHKILDKRKGEADRLFFPTRWAWLPVVHFFRFEQTVSMKRWSPSFQGSVWGKVFRVIFSSVGGVGW